MLQGICMCFYKAIVQSMLKHVASENGPLVLILQSYAGINLAGYHPPPGLTAGPLIFSVKIPTPGTTFQHKTPAPGSKK